MSKLDEFLNLPDVSTIRETVVERIDGRDFEFVVRPLSQEEHSEFQKRSTSTGKKINFDVGKYNRLVLESCIVEPNFKDENFLKKVKCQSAYDFMNTKFPAGVLADIASKIQSISGFDSIDMDIDTAKN